MILVDTSILIDFFRGIGSPSVDRFKTILERNIPFAITSVIYQEILQGAKSEKEFKLLDVYLKSQHFYHLRDPLASYQNAAYIYFKCRRNGITIRSTIDCLIAQTAIEHDAFLFHKDKDFLAISKLFPELKMY